MGGESKLVSLTLGGAACRGSAKRRQTYDAPPKRIRKVVVLLVRVLLGQVDEERGEDEAEEADVDGRYELLRVLSCDALRS